MTGLLLAASSPATAADTRIPLPTEGDLLTVAVGEQTILFGPMGIETLLPGRVDDRERVTVDVAPGGRIDRIHLEQHLTVHGLGDFRFRVPGPAKDVEPLPASEVSPGLRRGSMIWQGFSDGEKQLAATAELFPSEETKRLPIGVDLSMTVAGNSVGLGEHASGKIELRLGLDNRSAIPIAIASGEPEAGAVARAAAAIRRLLQEGRRPRPGVAGVPASIVVTGKAGSRVVQLEAPFAVEGELVFAAGTLKAPRAKGATVSEEGNGTHISFSTLLGGGEPTQREVVVSGIGIKAELPRLQIVATPALPIPASLRGSGGNRAELERIIEAMWRVARLRQYDGYLGNPDPSGPAETTYRFVLASPPRHITPVGPMTDDTFGAFGLVALAIAVALILLNAVFLWAHS